MNRRILLLGLGAALSAASSYAQFPGQRSGKGDGAGPRGGKGDGFKGKREPTPALEILLHEFHEHLKLRPEQEPLYERYAGAIRALAGDLAKERAAQRSVRNLTVLQRVDRNVDSARNRLTAIEEIALAATTLWANLNEEQQRAADPLLATLMVAPLSSA
jgi:hypothetical protein